MQDSNLIRAINLRIPRWVEWLLVRVAWINLLFGIYLTWATVHFYGRLGYPDWVQFTQGSWQAIQSLTFSVVCWGVAVIVWMVNEFRNPQTGEPNR